VENSNYTITERSSCFLVDQNKYSFNYTYANLDFLKKYSKHLESKKTWTILTDENSEYLKSIQKSLINNLFHLFNKIFIYYQTKGSANCEVVELNSQNIFTSSNSNDFFNKAYNHIKKSTKIKSSSKVNQHPEFNFIGNYTAHDFQSTNFKGFVLFIKESLLEITPEEIKLAQNVFTNILPTFEMYVLQSKYFELNRIVNLISSHKFEVESNDHSTHFHKERIELIGNLSDILKHELSNPLFGIQLTLELFNGLKNFDHTLVLELQNSLNRCLSIINNFSELFSKNNIQNDFVEINLNDLINEVLILSKSKLRGTKITIHNLPTNLKLKTNASALFHIFFNLIINAVEAMKDFQKSPELQIKITHLDNIIKNIDFIDNGPGIDEQIVNNIFKPFYTTKDNGTGLGLSMAFNLAKNINSNLKLISHNNGCNFRLEFNE
jgi:two-component system NtrC family sensor kinase